MKGDKLVIHRESVYFIVFAILAIIGFFSLRQSLFPLSFLCLLGMGIAVVQYYQHSLRAKIAMKLFAFVLFVFALLSVLVYFNYIDLLDKQAFSVSLLAFAICFVGIGLWGDTRKLHTSHKFTSIILAYFLIALLLISTFVGLYSFFGDVRYGGEPLEENTYSSFDYYYFSTMTFYSLGYGDFVPTGNARIIAMLEVFVGYLFHILMLGWIFSKFSRRN